MRQDVTKWARMALAVTVGLFLLLLAVTDADAGSVVELDEVSIHYLRFHPSARNPLFWNSTPKEELDLNMNTNILRVVGWDNTVHSMTDSSQYHVVGWNLRLYLRVTQYAEVGYWHFSKHVLDSTYPYSKWPVEDALMINLYIFRAKPGRQAVFQ